VEPNLRRMSEAPMGVPILVFWNHPRDHEHDLFTLKEPYDNTAAKGFLPIADVLAAVKSMQDITPEGFVYDSHESSTKWPSGIHCQRVVNFRKIPEPVEVRYECGADEKKPEVGDWLHSSITGEWYCVGANDTPQPHQLCARRVEVKR